MSTAPKSSGQGAEYVRRHNLTLETIQIPRRTDAGWDSQWARAATHWLIVVTSPSGVVYFEYSQGSAHTEPPGFDAILECLQLDFAGMHSGETFEEWAESLGLDPDSRKALASHEATRRMYQGWLRVVGQSGMDELLEMEW